MKRRPAKAIPPSEAVPPSKRETQFEAEAAYADSIFRDDLGDSEGSIAALERCLHWDPAYAPALLSMGSVEYQLGRRAEGRRLFESLLALPPDTPELCDIINKAGDFLIEMEAYADGLEIFRGGVKLFPEAAVLFQGLTCCAGHRREFDEGIAAGKRALEIEPGNQAFVSDLGWALVESGQLHEAERMLQRAVSMDPLDKRAANNLRICKDKIARTESGKKPATHTGQKPETKD